VTFAEKTLASPKSQPPLLSLPHDFWDSWTLFPCWNSEVITPTWFHLCLVLFIVIPETASLCSYSCMHCLSVFSFTTSVTPTLALSALPISWLMLCSLTPSCKTYLHVIIQHVQISTLILILIVYLTLFWTSELWMTPKTSRYLELPACTWKYLTWVVGS